MIVLVVRSKNSTEISVDQLLIELKEGNVENLVFLSKQIDVVFNDGAKAHINLRDTNNSATIILQYISTLTSPPKITFSTPWYAGFLSYLIAPMVTVLLLFVGLYVWAGRSNSQSEIPYGKSRARMISGDHPTVTFYDFAGLPEVKEAVAEVIEFLREPQKFIQLGARLPKGLLLYGPSGCGKSLLVKAMAGESGVPSFITNAAEFIEAKHGIGASRIRDLSGQAKRHSPCIVIIEDIDALGSRERMVQEVHLNFNNNTKDDVLNQSDRIQTIDQLLEELDGFDTDTNIIFVMTTNKIDLVDQSLLRPGRIDRYIKIDLPNKKIREAMLKIHVKGKPLQPDFDAEILASKTEGFTGAAIESGVNEAAIIAARNNRKSIAMEDFEESFEQLKIKLVQLNEI